MDLKSLKENVEDLDKNYQIAVGKLLRDNDVNLNENKNGIFVNLTELSPSIINKIQEYLNYVKEQEKQLTTIEVKKQQFKDNYFNITNDTV